YMKIEGGSTPIRGEVDTDGYMNYIEIESFQWGVGRAVDLPRGSSSGRETSAPNLSEINITKSVDSTSPLFFAEAVAGKSIQTVKIEFTTLPQGTDKEQTYLKYELK